MGLRRGGFTLSVRSLAVHLQEVQKLRGDMNDWRWSVAFASGDLEHPGLFSEAAFSLAGNV